MIDRGLRLPILIYGDYCEYSRFYSMVASSWSDAISGCMGSYGQY